jgi:hypothetical protein
MMIMYIIRSIDRHDFRNVYLSREMYIWVLHTTGTRKIMETNLIYREEYMYTATKFVRTNVGVPFGYS